jgi:hypothetical protein
MAHISVETDLDFYAIGVSLDNVIQSVASASSVALWHEAEYDLKRSKPLVPVETGALQASGRVEEDELTVGGGILEEFFADIIYGGPAGSAPGQAADVDYAVRVHEDLEVSHPHGGQAKFLEQPVNEEWGSGRAAERIAAELEQTVVAAAGSFASKGGRWLKTAAGKFAGSVQ